MNEKPLNSQDLKSWKGQRLVVLVEGHSDCIFYSSLLESMGYKRTDYFLEPLEGKSAEKLRAALTILIRPDRFETIQRVAILLDADENEQNAFELAKAAIKDSLNAEVAKPRAWSDIPGAKTRCGVFIVGNQDGSGEVESLAWESWTAKANNATMQQCVESYVRCVKAAIPSQKISDKAKVGAVLSILHEKDPRLGPAARANLFDFNSASFSSLRDFLKE